MEIVDTDIVPTFLNDNFSQLYENVVSLDAPLISMPDFLYRTRRTPLLRCVNDILNSPYNEREKLLDPLVDYVLAFDVSNPEAMEEAVIELRKKLRGDLRFGQYFTRLERIFDNLDPKEQRYVMKTTLTKIRTSAESMRLMVNDRIINEKNPLELVLLDQVLYLIQEFSDIVSSKLEKLKKLKLPELGAILFLMLKLEAVRRGKIAIKDMEEDIAIISISIKSKHVLITEEIAKPVLALMGE